jgi:hypothetical protein
MFQTSRQAQLFQMNGNDPNGWVTNPPRTFVKVINVTSKPALNGRCGIIISYSDDRQRYRLQLAPVPVDTNNADTNSTTGNPMPEMVALKVDNLVKASFVDGLLAQYHFLRHDPRILQQFTVYYDRFARVLPRPITPLYAFGIFGALLFLATYQWGFSRTLLFLSMMILLATLTAPDWWPTVMNHNAQSMNPMGTLRLVWTNLPMRFRAMLRENVPYGYGNIIADNVYLTTTAAIVFLVLFVYAIRGSGGNKSPVDLSILADDASFTSSSHSHSASFPNRSTLERYYKLGFEDAMAQLPFGKSMPPHIERELHGHGGNVRGADPAWSDNLSGPLPSIHRISEGNAPSSRGNSGLLSKASTMMSVVYLYRTIMSLGADASGNWSHHLAMANLQTLEPWKLGMLGLSIYRIIGAWIM